MQGEQVEQDVSPYDLRDKGYLSKKHSIDIIPYKNLPPKHKRGGTRTTIANKYIVL